MNPKFTLITHDYPPAHGGVARYLSSLVAAAKGQIDVWTPQSHFIDTDNAIRNSRPPATQAEFSEALRAGKFVIRNVKFWWPLWPKWLPLIKRCLEVPAENLILISHVFPIGTAAWIANLLGGNDYAVIFHGTDLKRAQTKWKRWLLRRICKKASIIIVNSDATQKLLKRLVPSADTIKLTPGLDPFELPSKPLAREKLNVGQNSKVILAVSRLVERKGIDTLIQAVANITARYKIQDGIEPSSTRYELVIIGNGSYGEPLHKLAELSGVNVRWITSADDETLHDWYAGADIFCLPGRETPDDIEGFGIVFLEAAFAGLPVIAGENGGAPEAVVNNETGILIPPTVEACAEALIKLLDDPNLTKKFGDAGHDRVIRDFNWSDRWQTLSLDVSVIIPCHNHARELQKTLESLSNQTIQIKQVIVVDDGSSDNPEAITQKFTDLLPMQFIHLANNSGAPFARNRGAESASGKFIMFLDADITLKPQAIKTLYQALVNNPEIDYAYCDFIWGKHLFKSKDFNEKDLKKQNYIHTSALIRRSANPVFDESLKKFQDWDLWLTMLKSGSRGLRVPQTLFTVKERKNGISRWLPSFVYKIPWPILGYTPKPIINYRTAESIIKAKHQT
jgi:phosphatidylinositol alpha-1,6-mannosyltransferase